MEMMIFLVVKQKNYIIFVEYKKIDTKIIYKFGLYIIIIF